jgi:hypothetical protein
MVLVVRDDQNRDGHERVPDEQQGAERIAHPHKHEHSRRHCHVKQSADVGGVSEHWHSWRARNTADAVDRCVRLSGRTPGDTPQSRLEQGYPSGARA